MPEAFSNAWDRTAVVVVLDHFVMHHVPCISLKGFLAGLPSIVGSCAVPKTALLDIFPKCISVRLTLQENSTSRVSYNLAGTLMAREGATSDLGAKFGTPSHLNTSVNRKILLLTSWSDFLVTELLARFR